MYKHWRDASGTAINHAQRLHRGARLFQLPRVPVPVPAVMACKTCCEAVVEGMGSVWGKVAEGQRHPGFETGAEEAVIAYSAPHCGSVEAGTAARSPA